MKFTLSCLGARLQKGSKKYLKKSSKIRRFVLTIIAIWLVIPALSVRATDDSVAPVEPIIASVAIGPTLKIEQLTFTVEVRQSARQLTMRQAQVRQETVKTATVSASEGEKRDWVQKAALQWGIDWKLLEAVWQVESGKQFYTAVRSYAGAQGPMQFMPGTWRAYAQDGNGDGIKNVLDARDSLFGAAKLLAVNGAASGNVDGALFRYNHSLAYVAQVKRIAAEISG